MGMNLECMLYLQSKNIISSQKNKILDVGPQYVYHCTYEQIKHFVNSQGGETQSEKFAKEAKRLEYFSTPRPDERTTLFSEICDLTNVEYWAFDVCPAFKTEILDLNFNKLPIRHREYYDVVLNFGTTEHVFNQWNSFEVMHDAVRVGGVIYCVLPASGYLDHGYYCYTPLFFRDLASANNYVIEDTFFAPAGQNSLRELTADIRTEGNFLKPFSSSLSNEQDKVPCYNIHVVMRKTESRSFTCALEIATAHSDANPEIAARYGAEGRSQVQATSQINPANMHSEELKLTITRLEREKNERIVERDKYHTERDQLSSQLAALYRSRSWRITQPIRAITRYIRGIKSAEAGGATFEREPANPLSTESSFGNDLTRDQCSSNCNSSLREEIRVLKQDIDAESWSGHWLQSHRWHTVKELAKGVAATYGYGIEGDVVEFGTMSGVSAEGLARAIARNDMDYREARPEHLLPKKKLFLFDSFEGLPPTDNDVDSESLHVKEGTWSPGTCRGLSRDELHAVVTKHLQSERVAIFEGWFKDTVPNLPASQKFGLIHVDGDLYSSTMDCLVPLFARGMVTEGALIYFDDWGPNRGSPNHGERKAWQELVEMFGIEFSDDGSYSLLARRFVIHSYRGQ